jgi:hypothetical protein
MVISLKHKRKILIQSVMLIALAGTSTSLGSTFFDFYEHHKP